MMNNELLAMVFYINDNFEIDYDINKFDGISPMTMVELRVAIEELQDEFADDAIVMELEPESILCAFMGAIEITYDGEVELNLDIRLRQELDTARYDRLTDNLGTVLATAIEEDFAAFLKEEDSDLFDMIQIDEDDEE